MVDAISTSLEKKCYCTAVFLDISQAFDRLWHEGLLFKLRNFLPPPVADYADDKVILSILNDPIIASTNLQSHLNLQSKWYEKWRVKVNHSKSVHTTFTLRHGQCPNVTINNIPIPPLNAVKYLGLILDQKLTWNKHITAKRLILNARSRSLKTILSKNKFTIA